MIPKPDGGWRPIGIYPSYIRLWFRARSIQIKQWEAEEKRDCLYAGPGMGSSVATWKAAFAAEGAPH